MFSNTILLKKKLPIGMLYFRKVTTGSNGDVEIFAAIF